MSNNKRKNRFPQGSRGVNKRARFMSRARTDSLGLRLPTYRGPVRTIQEIGESQVKQIVLPLVFPATTSGAGLYAGVIAGDPSSSPAWSKLAAVYDEYRVIALEAHFTPQNRYNAPTTNITPPIATVLDHTDGTALVSYTGTPPAADQFESVLLFSASDPFTRVIRISDFKDANFESCNAPVAHLWIKNFYSSTTAAATTIGYFTVIFRVEFKGRGV